MLLFYIMATPLPWDSVGLAQTYRFIDQSANGNKIIAATSSSIYYSTDTGATWILATINAISGTITGISISGDGSIAYACTTNRVYSSTGLATWTESSLFSGLGNKAYSCIAVSNKKSTGTGTPNLVYAGTNSGTTATGGFYGLLSNGTNAIILNNGSTLIIWLCVSLCKTYNGSVTVVGCSSSRVYSFIIDSNFSSTLVFLPSIQNSIRKVVITQNTDSQYNIYAIYSVSSAIKLSTDKSTFANLANTSGKIWRDISCRTQYASPSTDFVACTTSINDYLYTYSGTTLTSRNIQSDWRGVNGTSTTGTILYGIQNTSAFISQSTDSGVSCFIENSHILTIDGYKYVQDLTTKDKIYTTEGYFNLKYIGFNYINNLYFDKIYVYKNDFKDLYVMEGHSFLFKNTDNLYNENYDEKIYTQMHPLIIDGYSKVLVKDLKNCSIAKYEDIKDLIKDNHIKYYHIVLDNNDDKKQYAIYANSILTETMNEHYFLNTSELIKM